MLTCDADNPEELAYVITAEISYTSKNNQDVVYPKESGNRVAFFFSACEGSSDCGDVSVVPGVVINHNCSVRHACNLVTVVPP